MPIDLPNQPNGPTRLPPQPDDPPTLTDISNSVTYNQRLLVSHQAGTQNSASSDDIGRGMVYQVQLVQARADQDAAPAWFAPALAAGLAAGLAPLARIANKTYNLACGDGRTRKFQEVPFTDGTLPTAPPHNLPALTDLDDINDLTGPQATEYLIGYGLPHHHNINNRRNAICIEIGCTAMA